MRYLQSAFNEVCKDAKPAEGHYVTLMERSSWYGGPQEGGWWGTSETIVAYQWFPTEEQAKAAHKAVEGLAREMATRSRKDHGDQCLREMDWLEERRLEPDYLPEPDGPSEFYVVVSDGLPQEYHSSRTWE